MQTRILRRCFKSGSSARAPAAPERGMGPSEKAQGAKAEAGDVGFIFDGGRQSHGTLQTGEARATFETPSNR